MRFQHRYRCKSVPYRAAPNSDKASANTSTPKKICTTKTCSRHSCSGSAVCCTWHAHDDVVWQRREETRTSCCAVDPTNADSTSSASPPGFPLPLRRGPREGLHSKTRRTSVGEHGASERGLDRTGIHNTAVATCVSRGGEERSTENPNHFRDKDMEAFWFCASFIYTNMG